MSYHRKCLKRLETALQPEVLAKMPDNWFDLLLDTPPKEIARWSRPYYAMYYLRLKVPEHQFTWWEALDKPGPFKYVLSPRDHGKTMVIIRSLAEHATLYDNSENALVLGKTATQGKLTLDVIDKDLTKNKWIKRDFAYELRDYRKVNNFIWFDVEDENADDFDVDDYEVQRNARIESNGLLGDVTGGHFGWILLDDLADDANSRTPKARDDAFNWINGTIIPLRKTRKSPVVGIGTRKHWDDIYAKMKKTKGWQIIEQKAIIEWPESWDPVFDEDDGHIIDIINIKGNPKVLWESQWPIKDLLMNYHVMGSVTFHREYQNETDMMKGKLLKDAWLRHYAIDPDNVEKDYNILTRPPLDALTVYQGVDLAIRKTETSDFFCISTIGIQTKPYRIYQLDWYHDQISFPEQVQMVKNKFLEYRPEAIGIEANQYQVALAEQILFDTSLPIHEITSTQDKTGRIVAGSVNYQNGLYYAPIDHPKYDSFMDEYRAFDDGVHDDILDATNHSFRLLNMPIKKVRARAQFVDI